MQSENLSFRSVRLFFFLALSVIVTILHGGKFFFWDTISQVSIPANWYYINDFRYFFVPDADATGHPTFVAMYVALLWKIFGRSLLVSHLAMAPFIFGILVQLFNFIRRSDAKISVVWAVFIVTILDPTLVAQSSLITFDIVQIFFYLWCVNSILDRKMLVLAIGFSLLCLSSLRGMISGAGLIIFWLANEYTVSKKISFRTATAFIPGIALSILFFTVFYINKHWVIHNTVSEKWIEFSQFASPGEVLRNAGIFGWRLIDFGRIGIWTVFAVILIKLLRKKSIGFPFLKTTLLLSITQFLFFFPVCIFYRNPFGHRYLLPVIIPVAIFTMLWVLKYSRHRWLLYSLISAILLSGWLWVYPDKISTGWDATPAHWPYYKLRDEMVDYIRDQEIPYNNIGSFFPNTGPFGLTDLTLSKDFFKDDENLESDYVIFSNIFNKNDKIIDTLFSSGKWIDDFKISKGSVEIILFKRKGLD